MVKVLTTVGPALVTRPLWLATLRTLRNSFEHDQDGKSRIDTFLKLAYLNNLMFWFKES